MKLLLPTIAALLCSCAQHPKVTPIPNVAAVRVSNQETRKHIKHTQEHITKVQEDEKKVDDKLDSVARDLDRLLKK